MASDYALDVRYVAEIVTVKIIVDFVNDFHGDGRVYEVRRADLYIRSSGHYKLQSIPAVHDAADSNDGYIYSFAYLPHHPDRNRTHSRT